MKRSAVIILGGLLLGLAAYCALYYGNTGPQRRVLGSEAPELQWLKEEFHLSEGEFQRISKAHEEYLPECKEMCRKIDGKNVELRQLLAKSSGVTPEVERALGEAAGLREHCQRMMLKHFYEVAGTMPPEQGKRYLAWVIEKTFLAQYGMQER